MSKLVVYTAIFGEIPDTLQPLPVQPENVIYHCYMEGIKKPTQHETGWTLLPQHWDHKHGRLRARRHKLLSHRLYPDAEYTLWIDGCLTPKVDVQTLIPKHLGNHDICLFQHMQRDCIYEEIDACIAMKKDNEGLLRALALRYQREQYPKHRGLAETTAVLRRHSQKIRTFNDLWWTELRGHSVRDQVSFDYLAWVLSLDYATFPGTRCDCPYFDWRSHR